MAELNQRNGCIKIVPCKGREEDPMQVSPKATYKVLAAGRGTKTLKLMNEAEECTLNLISDSGLKHKESQYVGEHIPTEIQPWGVYD